MTTDEARTRPLPFARVDRRLLVAIYRMRCPRWLPVRALLLTAWIPFLFGTIIVLFLADELLGVPALATLAGKLLLTMLYSLVTFIPWKEAKLRLRPYANPELRRDVPDLENRDPRYGGRARESFPSGHVYTTGMVLVILLSQFGPWSLVATAPYALTMSWLRMHLGVHYPTDVLAGLALGLGTAAAAVLTYPAAAALAVRVWHSDARPALWITGAVLGAVVIWVSKRRT